MKTDLSTSLSPEAPACFDVITGDEVRRIVDCRLRWYGLDHIVVEELAREDAQKISVTLRDLRRNRRYRAAFPTTLETGARPATVAVSQAA